MYLYFFYVRAGLGALLKWNVAVPVYAALGARLSIRTLRSWFFRVAVVQSAGRSSGKREGG